ncbi:MAG: CinA family protein [Proteobacteria bacterium]|nr:CinA family protein [Burkholderiales bacterium]
MTADDEVLYQLADNVGRALSARGLMMASAESCTGGWVGHVMTMVPGSSEWFERGYITYTYISKIEMLGVRAETLETFGAVSEQTADQMARGALARSHAQVAVSVTGVAGPGGGTPDKPVGTVCFGWSFVDGRNFTETMSFAGDRDWVRRSSVQHTLTRLLDRLLA